MLVSLSDAKKYLKIPAEDTSKDEEISRYIAVVSEAVEGYCQRKFEKRNYVQHIKRGDLPDVLPKRLVLYHYPLSLQKIILDKKEIDISTLRVNRESGVVEIDSTFAGFDDMQVFYEAGFDPIPATIQDVVLSRLRNEFQMEETVGSVQLDGVSTISIPDVLTVNFDTKSASQDVDVSFGSILGSAVNSLQYWCSHRELVGGVEYVDAV